MSNSVFYVSPMSIEIFKEKNFFFRTLNKCSSPSSTNLLVHVGSSQGLEFFNSKLTFTWLNALKESANFNIDLLMLNNYDQMVKFIDFAIKNQLSGPFWVKLIFIDFEKILI